MSEEFPAHLFGLRAGSLVAGYRLEAQVGAGGMAVVFRARDERLGRLVALKVLAPGVAADPSFRRRFIAESRAAALVDDPHIIPIYEAGEADGALFIAMRFVRGGDLRLVLDREGALPPGRAVGFISPVASALDAAHGAGLVHRDVKPANILVDARQGRPDHVYLSDFGVSKGAISSVSLTGAGQFIGTPDYSAPEQIKGQNVDGRTDQYALACVAYQLLTGVRPFERDQGMAVLLAHLSEQPPSLASRRPGLPGGADQVLAKALAKAPEKRYGSCEDFARALREALGLAPYSSPDFASASDHPHTGTTSRVESPVSAVARTGEPVFPADPSAAATIDSEPAGRSADEVIPAAAGLTNTVSSTPERPGMVAASGRLTKEHGWTRQPGEPSADEPASVANVGDALPNQNDVDLTGAVVGSIGDITSAAARSPRSGWELTSRLMRSRPLAAASEKGAAVHTRRSHQVRTEQTGGTWGRKRIVTASLLLLVAIIVGGGYIALQVTQGQYYLASTNGQIVIYQGVNQQVLWYKLSHVYQETGIQLAQVPTNDQQTVSSYPPGNLAHAQSSVANIRAAVTLCQQQYTALRDWVVMDNRYLAQVAQANKNHKSTAHIAKPNPPTAPAVGPFCQPSAVFGIPASALSPTPAGRS